MTFKGCTCNLCKATAIGVVASWSVVTFVGHDPFCWKQRGAYCEMPWDLAHGPHSDQPVKLIEPPDSVRGSTSGSSNVHLKAADFSVRSPEFGSPVLTVRET
jgi:hypothetical protein